MKITIQNLKFFYGFTFFMNLGVGMLGLGIPLFALKLGANNVELGAIGAIGSFVYILFVPFSGGITDRFPKNVQAGIGAILFGAMIGLIPFVPSLYWIYLILVCYIIGLALVWPALEATMSHYFSGKDLARGAGWYNLSWSSGAMIGIYIAGWIYAREPGLVFWSAGGICILNGIIFMSLFRVPPKPEEVVTNGESGPEYLLYLFWLANAMSYFAMNEIRNIYPKLARDLGFSSENLGFLLLCLTFAQASLFVILNRTARWHNKFWPLTFSMVLVLAGLILTYFSQSMAAFAVAFLLIGAGGGISYTGSLYYAVSLSPKLAGSRSGWHEFYVGLGGLAGPLLGGIFAQYIGVRSPYLMSGALVLVMMAIQFVYRKRAASLR